MGTMHVSHTTIRQRPVSETRAQYLERVINMATRLQGSIILKTPAKPKGWTPVDGYVGSLCADCLRNPERDLGASYTVEVGALPVTDLRMTCHFCGNQWRAEKHALSHVAGATYA